MKHSTTGETPVKLLFNRELRTSLHLLLPDSKYIVEKKQENQVKNFIDKRCEKFAENDVVMARDFRKYHQRMTEANVVKKLSENTCLIKFKGGVLSLLSLYHILYFQSF